MLKSLLQGKRSVHLWCGFLTVTVLLLLSQQACCSQCDDQSLVYHPGVSVVWPLSMKRSYHSDQIPDGSYHILFPCYSEWKWSGLPNEHMFWSKAVCPLPVLLPNHLKPSPFLVTVQHSVLVSGCTPATVELSACWLSVEMSWLGSSSSIDMSCSCLCKLKAFPELQTRLEEQKWTRATGWPLSSHNHHAGK